VDPLGFRRRISATKTVVAKPKSRQPGAFDRIGAKLKKVPAARKNQPATTAALDRIAAALEGLPASRRGTIEEELLALDRRATYSGGKRGPKPKHGETMSAAVLVKMTPARKAEMAAEAKRLGLANIAEYVRELHRRQEKNGGGG
jgi:hypothetical protein